MSTEDPDMELVKKACQTLMEHFDSVQIFVTRHEPYESEGTVNISYGDGNWFTRYGQVKEWTIKTEERTKKFVQSE
jgi:hypothetical protein